MKAAKNKPMSRAEAQAMYDDLRKVMSKQMPDLAAQVLPDDSKPGKKGNNSAVAKDIAQSIKSALASERKPQSRTQIPVATQSYTPQSAQTNRGPWAAMGMVLTCAIFKIALSALEASGVLGVSPVLASINQSTQTTSSLRDPASPAGTYSKEEVRLLTSLDSRRVELEERNKKIDFRERDLEKRDAEFAAKLTELRELTDKLKNNRERDEKRRSNQYEQLANVYGSMEPKEAASLIEQLDVTIALQLIQRMPEKRIGQILALMSPEKALAITKMLGGIGSKG